MHTHQQRHAFVNSNASNVTLSHTNCEQCVTDFEALLKKQHAETASIDVGAVKIYACEGKLVAWVDYELYVGCIV